MQSRKLPDLPIATSAATAIMINNHVFVYGGVCCDVVSACKVQVYSVNDKTWSTLPLSPLYNCQGVAIKGKLVLLGGRDSSTHAVSNCLSTWSGRVWHQELPPMPTKRIRPGVTTYQNLVVVAGGRGEDGQTILSNIAILNITTLQWSMPQNVSLPRPMYAVQFTTSNTHLYVASATFTYKAATDTGRTDNTVWQLPLTALMNALATKGDSMSHQWTEIAPTPYYKPTLIQDTAHVVAVGGYRGDSYMPTSDVFIFNPNSNKWSKVGPLGVPRVRCAAVSLNRTSFIVCGGIASPRNPNTHLSSVEMVRV